MDKTYSRIDWKNKPSSDTPLGATNLNKMDKAIDDIDSRVVVMNGRIDEMSKTPGGTTGDAELEDIRVSSDGKRYPNAGTAVRQQAKELKTLAKCLVSLRREKDTISNDHPFSAIMMERDIDSDVTAIADVGILYITTIPVGKTPVAVLTVDNIGQEFDGKTVSVSYPTNKTALRYGHGQRFGIQEVGVCARGFVKVVISGNIHTIYTDCMVFNYGDGNGGLETVINDIDTIRDQVDSIDETVKNIPVASIRTVMDSFDVYHYEIVFTAEGKQFTAKLLPAIDNTLSLAKAPADSKAVGDAIAELRAEINALKNRS